MAKLSEHYNRHDPAHGDEAVMFRAARGLQSAELNEQQSILAHAIKGIGDAILSDGSVQRGGDVVINPDTGATTCGATAIYLRGRVRDVPEKQLTIPTVGTAELGVWLSETIVTEIEDPSLRDPAEGTRNYDEGGAARLRIACVWGLSTDNATGNFYKVYDIEDGSLRRKHAPPDTSGFANALARYDRDNNGGNYVIHGMSVVWLSHDDAEESYSVIEGKAHVHGYEVEMPAARRKRYPFDPDLQTVVSEPHQFTDQGGGKMRVNLNHAPIHDIRQIDITKETTVEIRHGSYAGVADPLPLPSVIEIVEVKQGGTTYRETADYLFAGGQLDWSPGGAEPAPGSTYQVKLRHRAQVQPESPDERGFTVSGAVANSLVLVDYQWRMPRIDTLILDREGNIERLKGLPSVWQPKGLPAPSGSMELARLHHSWFKDAPTRVDNTATVAVSMGTLQDMRRDIFDLYDLVAIERLKSDAVASAPAAVRGVFVDPFLDDDMRDLGQSQTAAIVDGVLMLPIRADVKPLEVWTQPVLLPYEHEVIIEQTARTGTMKVNPYAAFDPIPGTATLMPPVDFWTETRAVNHADVTRTFGSGVRTTSSTTVERRTTVQAAEFLRPITIRFRIEGMKEDEPLHHVTFDGIQLEVTP